MPPRSLRGLQLSLLFIAVVVIVGCNNRPKNANSNSIAVETPTSLSVFPAEAFDPKHSNFLRYRLKQYGLSPLSDRPLELDCERYRFFWVRSFHPAVVFEIEFKSDGMGFQRNRIWKKSSHDFHWVTDKSTQLSEKDRKAYQHAIKQWELFALPWYDDSAGIDGADWFVELQRGEKYHALYRHTPNSGPVWEFGRLLIEGAIRSPYMPIY